MKGGAARMKGGAKRIKGHAVGPPGEEYGATRSGAQPIWWPNDGFQISITFSPGFLPSWKKRVLSYRGQ